MDADSTFELSHDASKCRGDFPCAEPHIRVKTENSDSADEAQKIEFKTKTIKQEKIDSGERGEPDKNKTLTHKEAMGKFSDGLIDIIKNDPLLHDLPQAVTLEEVNSQIALEYGQAMTVNVHRADGITLPIVVVSSATVLDLKKAIRRHMTLKLERAGHTAIVSWRYVWRRYCLVFEGQKLLEDKKPIKEYGIRNRDSVNFMKVLQKRWQNATC